MPDAILQSACALECAAARPDKVVGGAYRDTTAPRSSPTRSGVSVPRKYTGESKASFEVFGHRCDCTVVYVIMCCVQRLIDYYEGAKTV